MGTHLACPSWDCGANQILRLAMRTIVSPGGECSSGTFETTTAAGCPKASATTTRFKVTGGATTDTAALASCGCTSDLTSTWQHPVFAISPHCPCIVRQQADSA